MKMNLSTPFPLGATLDAEGCNFAIYAPANRDILLALFHADGSYETHQLEHEYAGSNIRIFLAFMLGRNTVI